MIRAVKLARSVQLSVFRMFGGRSDALSSSRLFVQGQGLFGATAAKDLKDSPNFHTIDVDGGQSDPIGIKKVAASWGHSVVLHSNGKLFMFGRPYDFVTLFRLNKFYRFSKSMGQWAASLSNKMSPEDLLAYLDEPTEVKTYGSVIDVAISAALTAFITADGSVFCFGNNRWDQLGYARGDHVHEYAPVRVADVPPCVKIDTGLQHCITLTREGQVYTWGKAERGQLGTILVESTYHLPFTGPPAQVKIGIVVDSWVHARRRGVPQPNLKAVDVSAGGIHSAALAEDGSVYVWGGRMSVEDNPKNMDPEVKLYADQILPRKIDLPEGRRAVEIHSSFRTLVIWASDGSVWAMGMAEGDRNGHAYPLRVQTDFHQPRPSDTDLSDCTPSSPGRDSSEETALGLPYAEVDPSDGNHYLVLPHPGVGGAEAGSDHGRNMMFKGHMRVAVVTQEAPVDMAAVRKAIEEKDNERALKDDVARSASVEHQGAITAVISQAYAFVMEKVDAMKKAYFREKSNPRTLGDDVIRGPSVENRAHFPTQGIFEVVIYQGEAFLVELVLPMDAPQAGNPPTHYRLRQYSSGWQHRLMVVDEI